MPPARYILEDEPGLIRQLDEFLATLKSDLDAQAWWSPAQALVLAGGYGRGEGGVFRAAEAAPAQLYNDLEFYLLLLPGREPAAAAWCHRWEEQGTAQLGIDVEFKRLGTTVFEQAAPSMFYFDLLQSHRLVHGNAAILGAAPARLRDPALIPLSEPIRLLFNRGSGLLFAGWRLADEAAGDDGFVERNLAKARLALGDAVLAAAGRHDGSCRERARRLAAGDFPQPENFAEILRGHEAGVVFKLRPRHRAPGRPELIARHRELVQRWLALFLWLEGRRLGVTFVQPDAYVGFSGRLFPLESAGRNLLLHVRDRLRRGAALPGWTDYPRAALQRCLVAALAESPAETAPTAARLGATPANWRATYQRWWGWYN